MAIPAKPITSYSSVEDEIRNNFAYHCPPDDAAKMRHTAVRALLRDVAIQLVCLVPQGRDRALMLTALEEAMHWANAGIAKQHPIAIEGGPLA